MATYLRMSPRVPMQPDKSYSMGRVSVRGRAGLLFKKQALGLTAIRVLERPDRERRCFQ